MYLFYCNYINKNHPYSMNILNTILSICTIYSSLTIFNILNYSIFNNNKYVQYVLKIQSSNRIFFSLAILIIILLQYVLYLIYLPKILELLTMWDLTVISCYSLIELYLVKKYIKLLQIHNIKFVINKLLIAVVIFYYLIQINIIYVLIIQSMLYILLQIIFKCIFKLFDSYIRPEIQNKTNMFIFTIIKQEFQKYGKIEQIHNNILRRRTTKIRENIYAK
jgi:hypothetical protein